MKSLNKSLLLLIVCFFSLSAVSQETIEMSLKITYNGVAACGHQVLIKSGITELGKGTTNEQGEVTFNNVILDVKNIDVFGAKKSANGDKSWELKGYVVLNERHHADIKFETILTDISKEMDMPQSALAEAWGLTINCDGSTNSSSLNDGEKKDEATEEED